jgi:hypothetical protein
MTLQQQVYLYAHSILTIIQYVVWIIFGICVIVAGLMRMLSFGNERRIAVSNIALTAAIVGGIMVAIVAVLQGWIQNPAQ